MDYASIYPVIGIRAQKRLGKLFIFKQYGNFKVVTKYYYPENPQTALQQAWRGVLADGVDYWAGFSEAVKGQYNVMTSPKAYDGYRRFLSMYLNARYPPTYAGDLLQETGDRLLLETGGGILLES